uniref:Uncharacterized protein n=1 Tax=Acrobeloides nanus TaxID=290746 RepID=A0A914CB21_9BILA
MGAFVYVELGTSIQKSGGDLAYLCHVKWYSIAFSYVGVGGILNNPVVTAIGAQTFSEYITKGLKIRFTQEHHNYWAQKLISFSLLMPLTYLNFFSVKKFVSRFQVVASFFTLLASSLVICTGFYWLIFKGETQNFQNVFANTTYAPGKIVSALFAGLFSYDGWDVLNYGIEEVSNPKRNMPLAILIGLSLVAAFYLSLNISYYTVLNIPQLLESNAVAVTFAQKTLGSFQYVMPFAISILLIGAINSTIFASSRYLYAAARSGYLPSFISCTNKEQDSPRTALFVHLLLTIVFSFAGDLNQLINYSSFATWSQRAFSILALLYIRYKHIKVHPHAVKMPIFMPILFVAICISLLVITVAQDFTTSIVSLSFILGGWLAYLIFKWDRTLQTIEWYKRKAAQLNERAAVYTQIVFNGIIDSETKET